MNILKMIILLFCLFIIYLFYIYLLLSFFLDVDIDRYTLKEFKRLANQVPEAGVSYCPGYQYFAIADPPGQDSYWVKNFYQDVSITKLYT